MASQHEPGLIGPCAITDEDADMLRSVARRMQHLRSDVAKRKHLFVVRAPEWKRNVRVRREHIFCAGCLGETPARGDVVSMNVGVEDKMDAHAAGICGA